MLSTETVDAVFTRMVARYGNTWLAKWDGVPLVDLKADWGRVLANASRPALLYGLDNLPEFPPTAHQFREVCTRAPAPDTPRLPQPKPDRARVAAELAKLAEARPDGSPRLPTDWIAALEARRNAGEPMTIYQADCLRIARKNLHLDRSTDDVPLGATVPAEALPPSMRDGREAWANAEVPW